MTVIRTALNIDSARDIELASDGNGYMWKQIIPMNYRLTYKGRNLLFDRNYLANIREAFKQNALGEQTAFQLADDENSHYTDEDKAAGRNYDPERYRGEIVDMKVVNSGLYGKYKLTPEGLDLVKKNPKLGVSASLKEGYERDGKTYPVVMKHCLGTLSPKIKGMSPWTSDEVTLSDDLDENEEVLDLTMPTDEKDEKETVEVSKDWMDSVNSFMEEQKKFNTDLESALGDEDDDDESDDEADLSEDDDDEDEDDPRSVELSERMTLAEKRALAAENKTAAAEFRTKAAELRRSGVPKAMIDLAEPFLATSESFEIQLSDGSKKDPVEAMWKLLEEAKGTIDMSDEDGHGVAKAADDAEDKALDEIVNHDFMLDDF